MKVGSIVGQLMRYSDKGGRQREEEEERERYIEREREKRYIDGQIDRWIDRLRKKDRINREERQREVDRDGKKKYDKIVK